MVYLEVSLDNLIKQDEGIRKNIQFLEKIISEQDNAYFGDTDNCPLKHSFADGCYVREIFIPKGNLVVGKIHKHSHPNFLMEGEVIVITEEGKKHLKAPCSMISAAGTKRVVYTLENSRWITVHVTDKTDLKEIEQEIIVDNFARIGLKDFLPEASVCHG